MLGWHPLEAGLIADTSTREWEFGVLQDFLCAPTEYCYLILRDFVVILQNQ